ncbi:MAG: nucleotidyltransferase [Lachnospiraceae bacterium]|nr:nucleotidyltransferase [Lachnospiraceae bacterium]
MKVTGIIAEYNPFHNGHQYQYRQIRNNTDTDYIVVVMNGDFMQRGEPAILNKYDRTHMALEEGADLVIELPVFYGTGSAEYFAAGGIYLLQALGCIDRVCFGCEYNDLSVLSDIATIYSDEQPDFRNYLNKSLKEGNSYPKARTNALLQYSKEHGIILPDGIEKELSKPNNVLAIEYLKTLQKLSSDIKAYPIKRVGQDYHACELPDSDNNHLGSASAIRSVYADRSFRTPDSVMPSIEPLLPEASIRILTDAYGKYAPLSMDDFYPFIRYLLLTNEHPLTDYLDISEDLANRMESIYQPELSYSEYVDAIINKQYTRTRIMRCLLHILLGITKPFAVEQKDSAKVPYARILGFRKESSGLLTAIREQGDLIVIQKVKDALDSFRINNPSAAALLQLDIRAAHLYEQICCQTYHSTIHNEYTQGMIIL